MVSKLTLVGLFMLVAAVHGIWLPKPISTVVGPARKTIKIMKFGIKAGSRLSPCDPNNAPRSRSYNGWEDCGKNCPKYCASIRNCNATCVLEDRCVCATNTYCLYDRDRPEGDSYHLDCFTW